MTGASRAPFKSLLLAVILAACLAALFQCACRAGISAPASHSPAAVGSSAGPRALYAQTISIPADASPALKHVADDIANLLGRATRATFTVESGGKRGILLLHADSPEAPADLVDKLAGHSREGYVTRSRGDGRLFIVAEADEGVIFGAYQYLERLGIHFFLPNDRFTIVPSLDGIEREEELVVEPAFRVRQFTGTGGLGGKGLVVDSEARLAQRWETWKVRNGFGEQFHISGHVGESFNVHNRETLIAHPEFLAKVGGQRVAWSKGAKLDPSNPAAVDLFVRDRLAAYRAQRGRNPSGQGSFAVSVEPADGGGHCDSEECGKIGSASDQEFFLANAVARALRNEFPDARASLFAYNMHAEVPNIPIEPNVYVTIVPYAYLRTGQDPEDFVRAWTKKKSPLSIYDYWAIPDWVADQPSFDFLSTPAKKLRFWQSQRIEGVIAESTFSAGAMGLAWHIAGHLMWDPSRDPKLYEDLFLRESFGSSEPPMRRMLERWASGFLLGSIELHDSFADLREAFARSKSASVDARLADFAGYVQYLRLRHEWLTASAAESAEKTRALIVHLWRIYDSAMVDTFRLQQLILRKAPALAPELDPKRPDLPVWRELKPATLADARQWVESGLRAYPDLGVHRKVFDGELQSPTLTSVPTPSGNESSDITLLSPSHLELAVPDTNPARISVVTGASLQIRLFDDTGSLIRSEQLAASDSLQEFEISVAKAGTCRLDLRTARQARVMLRIPNALGATLTDFRIPRGPAVPDLYFFVPASEPALAIYDPNALGKYAFSLLDADGREPPFVRHDGGRLLIATVSPTQRGRIWTLRRAAAPNSSLWLINAPQRFALTRQALKVPQSALRGASTPNQSSPK